LWILQLLMSRELIWSILTLASGVRFAAVKAIPLNPPSAVIIPETWKESGSLGSGIIGNLSADIIPEVIFAPSIFVIPEPEPLN
jgi:hypothetical protein